ncbi:UrcA family protein [Sandarakinorhabdus limnophila]|jgi:UrcA family protein|uniref:UrcA family protein n=1 Tax=Sandarakinorhabdus limnophila TaxID=210512 RepID=UPI0037C601E6
MFTSAQNFSRNLVGAAGTLFFAGLCIAGATATPANAQIAYGKNEAGHKVAYVAYADLDLGSPAGRSRLENRLRAAAKQVCHGSDASRMAVAEEYACYQETLKATRSATMAAIAADKVTG